ncbi:unnamed protein product, partial [Iphiclides podalirius]
MDKIEDIIKKPFQTTLIFFVNGKKVVEKSPEPEWTLLWYLRKKLQLTGTKYGCGEGGCGACTVMISQYVRDEDRIRHFAVNACLTPVCAMHGLSIITVEGIGSTQDRLHPVQERLAKAHGSQCGFCTPGIIMSIREDELEIISTTQNPGDIAHIVSETLRIPSHKVVAKVKRIGGGFGGKETRAALLAIPVAIAAYKLKKPVRAVLDRDEDMQVTGYRHPFLTKYKVAFDIEGKICGVLFNFFANAGNYMDISCAMIDRALNHMDNCYYIPNIEINAYLCKTNLPSNTAFRGFGAPKAMLAAECMIRDIATVLNKDYEEIVRINLYKEGDLTHYNQKLTYCTLSRCWNECVETSNYKLRKAAVKEYNRCNRWKKKGFSDIPKEFNVSLLKGAPNPRAVYSSKAVGEPPLFLAASVFFAIKEAIASARSEFGASLEFVLEAPATCARIRMACEDEITKQVKPTIKARGQPWNVLP